MKSTEPQPHSTQPESSAPLAGGEAPHTVPPDFARFALPFPTRVERFVFRRLGVAVLVTGLVSQASRIHLGFDLLFCLVTLILAVSAALFRFWMSSIPTLLHQLYDRCAKKNEHAQFMGFLDDAHAQLMSRRRFIPIGAGLAIALAFIGVLVWRRPTFPIILAWSLCLLPWAWMLGAAGSVAFWIARLVRAVGEAGILHILPEHPDGCGGLRPVGTFFARMVSPLLLVSVLLGFTSVDPELTLAQVSVFWARPFSAPERFSEGLDTRALELELRSEVGASRVEHLKKECTRLEVPPESELYQDCIASIVTEAQAVDEAQRQGHRRLWNPRVVPFARVGLLILIASIGLCFIWPLGSVHLAMLRARDKAGMALAKALDEAENHFSKKLKEQELFEAAELSEHLEKVRKQVLRVRHYPVWPFDAASVSRVAIPQFLALASTLGGLLADWLSR